MELKGITINGREPTASDATEAREIARQAGVELAILLGIEQSLRIALGWMKRGSGSRRKLSTLRFHTGSIEHHLGRMQVLADHGGYMHLIADANPHLANEVAVLRNERKELHTNLERIVVRLDHISHDDACGFEEVCTELERCLDELKRHGQKEIDLRQRSFTQEEGASG